MGEELGIEIELIQTEAGVGDFNADIVAKEVMNDRKIIIENQLERTDHDHLGKIITYAAGIDAEFIVWIVREVRAEHHQAVDWLNEHTDKNINFFLLRMELWQIADSPPAPKFHVISQPNNWTKAVRNSVAEAELSETKLLQLEFWNGFKEFCETNEANFRLRATNPQHWYDISIGVSFAHIALTINTQRKEIACELYIPDSKELYYFLADSRQEIEESLGDSLDWMELPEKKACRIKLSTEGDITVRDNWPACFDWLSQKAEKFISVLGSQAAKYKERQ